MLGPLQPQAFRSLNRIETLDLASNYYLVRSQVCIIAFNIDNYRFTELYVDDLQHSEDLQLLIQRYLERFTIDPSVVNGIIRSLDCCIVQLFYFMFVCYHRLYREVIDLAQNKLQDGTGRRPHYRCKDF